MGRSDYEKEVYKTKDSKLGWEKKPLFLRWKSSENVARKKKKERHGMKRR